MNTTGDTLNILWLINKNFTNSVMAIFNPRNNFMISKNDGQLNAEVIHKRDVLINANTMINLSRPHYTKAQINAIRAAQAMPDD